MNFTTSHSTEILSILHCVTTLLTHCQTDFVVLASEEHFPDLVVERFNEDSKYDDEIDDDLWNHGNPECYLIEGSSQEVLQKNFFHIKRSQSYFNAGGKFFFVSNLFSGSFLKLLKPEHIVNAVFFEISTGKISTYFPFGNETSFVETGSCSTSGSVKLTDLLFPPKLPKTWQNSSLLAMYSDIAVYAMCHNCPQRGIEIDILATIADYFGINLEFYQIINYDEDILQFIHNKKHVYFGGQLIRDTLEFTYPYFTDSLAWFVPSPKPLKRWRYIFTIFSYQVWLSWLLIVMIFSITWLSGDILFVRRVSVRSIFLVPVLMFRWFLEQMYHVRVESSYHVVLKVFILFTCVMMNFLFRSKFTYLLNGVNYENSVDTFEKILSSGLKVGCTNYVSKLISVDSRMKKYLQQNHVECRGVECLNRTAFDNDLASVSLIGVARYAGELFRTSKGHLLLKKLDSPTFSTQLVALFNRGHPMFSLFNKNMQYLLEGGIIDQIASRYDNFYPFKKETLRHTRMMRLAHVAVPLTMWAFGIASATLVYIWELTRTR